jgi:hypothetical protein
MKKSVDPIIKPTSSCSVAFVRQQISPSDDCVYIFQTRMELVGRVGVNSSSQVSRSKGKNSRRVNAKLHAISQNPY